MPALDGRIKVAFDEFDNTSQVYMRFQHQPRHPKLLNLGQKTMMASTLDMFRYCSVHLGIFDTYILLARMLFCVHFIKCPYNSMICSPHVQDHPLLMRPCHVFLSKKAGCMKTAPCATLEDDQATFQRRQRVRNVHRDPS